jgi:lipopolysaccharide transport system ATP-binding protein
MSDFAIRVEGLSKRYLIGGRERGYSTFREALLKGLVAPFDRLRRLGGNVAVEETFWALRDVSFEVERGEIVGVIGRNGAGKSTLLKILSRIAEPTTGRVTTRGRVLSLLEVGTGFHPELTGRENIYLNGVILGMSRAEVTRRFDEIVAFAEVEKFLDTPVKRYSSGMQLRLGFAVAAHLEPEILVVDEVLAVGDVEFQRKCLGKMGDVARGGRTVLLVSHQLGTLRDLCSRGILLTAGRATTFETIEEALRQYLHAHTEAGSDRRNFRHVANVRGGNGSEGPFHLFFGDPLVISTTLKDLPEIHSGFTVAINDAYGRRVSLFSTNPHDGVALPSGGAAEVTFTIDFCAYAPGQYYVDLALTEPNVRIIEEASNVLKFEVLPAPRQGTLAYGAPYGEFFPPHTWSIETRRLGCLDKFIDVIT